MALATGGILELRATGDDTNGGYFNPASSGVDYSQQDTAAFSATGVSTFNGNLYASGIGFSFNSSMIGNGVCVNGSAWYEIISVPDPSQAVLDRAAGGSGLSIKIGGALKTVGVVGALITNTSWTSWRVYQKAGSYSVTSNSANVANGRFAVTVAGTVNAPSRWVGYDSVRGDLDGVVGGNRPVISWGSGTSGTTFMSSTGAWTSVENIICEKGATTSTVATGIVFPRVLNCTARDFGGNGISASIAAISCSVTNNGAGGTSTNAGILLTTAGAYALNCYVETVGATASSGFLSSAARCSFINCVAYRNGTQGIGFYSGLQAFNAINCVAYGYEMGFQASLPSAGTVFSALTNCIAIGASTTGFFWNSATFPCLMFNCAGFNNGTGGSIHYSNADSGSNKSIFNFKSLTADPFVDSTNKDFRLNSTTGGGALLRAAGFPSSIPDLSPASYADIGAYQHQDTGGGTPPGPSSGGVPLLGAGLIRGCA